jgi:hypothetical protein
MQVLQLLEALLPSMPRPSEVVPEASLDMLDAHAHDDSVSQCLQHFSGNAELRAQLCTDFLPLVHKIHTVHSLSSIRSVVCILYHLPDQHLHGQYCVFAVGRSCGASNMRYTLFVSILQSRFCF